MNTIRCVILVGVVAAAVAGGADKSGSVPATEARHYRLVTLPHPKDCMLEVGGLDFRPDGQLLACTRRGEVWRIANPGADDVSRVKFELFASGLHEALGLVAEGNNSVLVVQ